MVKQRHYHPVEAPAPFRGPWGRMKQLAAWWSRARVEGDIPCSSHAEAVSLLTALYHRFEPRPTTEVFEAGAHRLLLHDQHYNKRHLPHLWTAANRVEADPFQATLLFELAPGGEGLRYEMRFLRLRQLTWMSFFLIYAVLYGFMLGGLFSGSPGARPEVVIPLVVLGYGALLLVGTASTWSVVGSEEARLRRIVEACRPKG